MEELLEKINQTFDNVINASNEDIALQLRIVKGNINTLFKEAMNNGVVLNNNIQPVQNEVAQVSVGSVMNVQSEPVNVVEQTPAETIVESVPVQNVVESAPVENVEEDAPKKSVLICDDSIIIRNYLQKTINGKYETTIVTGGQDAISFLADEKFDLLLLDLMMPGIDGFGVLDFLKKNYINVPVIIISGDTTKETIDKAFTYNVVDMIEKPFSEKIIMEKISRILD